MITPRQLSTDRWRDTLIVQAHDKGLTGFLCVVVTCAVAALIAAWLVRPPKALVVVDVAEAASPLHWEV
jgi:hypothetical protein